MNKGIRPKLWSAKQKSPRFLRPTKWEFGGTGWTAHMPIIQYPHSTKEPALLGKIKISNVPIDVAILLSTDTMKIRQTSSE